MEYRVYGPPGTGKTSWLAAQIRAAVLARGSDDVIVASFTRGAAQELAGRDLPIDRSRIGTLHAHCYRALGSPQIAETKLPLWNEDNPGLPMGDRDGSLDEPAWEQNGGHSAADLMCSEAQNYRARQYPLRLWPDITAEFYRKWCSWKQDMGFIDFTDMLELALDQIDEAPGAPSVGFFDEVQDFTPLELALVRKWGAHMDRFVLAGDDDQCHPEGTDILTTTRGYVPIEKLNPDTDRLVCCDLGNGKDEIRRKGYSFQLAKREFYGQFIRLHSAQSEATMTPEHRVVVKWRPEAVGKKCVYLMRRDRTWRIGLSDMLRIKAGGIFGPGQRARQEDADALWILTACESEQEALLLEDKLAIKFGISKMVFKAPTSGQLLKHSQERLDLHHNSIFYIAKPIELLAEFGRQIDYPFWEPDGRQRGATTRQRIRACNVIDGLMDIPVLSNPSCKKAEWLKVSFEYLRHTRLPVYSLNVEQYHNYIADNQVVLNCIYGFKGATPAAFLTPDLPDEQKRVLGQSYRLPRAVYDYVQAWIKRVKVREPKNYRPTDRQGEVVRTASTFLEDEAIIREAIDYAEAGKTVMFLATCSYQVRSIVKSLRIHAYPFHNPYRRKRGDWNPLRRNKSMPADRLLAFLRIDEGTWDTEAREWTGADLKKWVPLIDAKCGLLLHGAKKAVKEMGDGPVKDYSRYFEPERFEKLFYSDDRLDILKDWMLKGKRAMMGYSVDVAKHHGGKMVRQTPRITVGTIHSVKGGEADVVYVFPDLSKAGFQEYDSRRRDSVLRLFYVAFTRAKERLVLCSPSGYFKAEF